MKIGVWGESTYGNRILDGLNSEVVARNAFSFKIYRKVLTVFYVEERMKAFARQGKCSFVASSRGHELTQFPKAPKPCRR